MKIFVINLERSQDRREFMCRQLDALGLSYEFFRATDASRGELDGVSRYDERLALRRLGHALQPSEVGCFASHYRLWQRCVADDLPLVVMEDDVQLEAGFACAMTAATAIVDSHRFVRLCGLASRGYRDLGKLSDGHRLVRYLKGPRGTQCYALAPAGAQRLLQGAQRWFDAVDLYIDAFWLHGLASYAVLPFHVRHDMDHGPASLIGSGRWAARRPLLHKLRREATHLAYRLRRGLFNLRQLWRERQVAIAAHPAQR
ncbi:glycosyltransferase family 25 protein [Panacagrimonas sp.]|uniref:glycosyltransferase family 25 protein n=1 Tax=Panacagrimonas sp. TaxID=2480088 RepID=UPI003B52FBE0